MGIEVENILNEIRERVRRDHQHDADPAAPETTGNNGGRQVLALESKANGELESAHSESLKRLAAHLTTTSRAWDRLPPLYSNRKGGTARFELWIKARLKAMSRWFIWEQVNFNSAVHHALTETLHALSTNQQELAALRGELARQAEAARAGAEQVSRELTTVRAGIEAQTVASRKETSAHIAIFAARSATLEERSTAIEARSTAIEARSAAIETRVSEITAEMTRKVDEARAELTPRLAELAGELRESESQLREEQRVCFKQLSLEASETAVNEERGRRLFEARLAELEKTLSNDDK